MTEGPPSVTPQSARVCRLDPRNVLAGRGALVYVEGSVSAPPDAVRKIEVVLAGRVHPAIAYRALGRARTTCFWTAAVVADSAPPGRHVLGLRVRLSDGSSREVAAEGIEVVERTEPPVEVAVEPRSPLVAICLATHNPPEELFERQVASLRSQSHADFVCIVADDASEPDIWERVLRVVHEDRRFVVSRSPVRLGFYRNFERCVGLVPESARFVALSDQDDVWHRDKLRTLIDTIEESGALLVYSDMNIVSETGGLIAPTYWSERRNNYADLGSLLLVNTITGAASLFRRELLQDVLPFPPDVGKPYHDHWIASVALSLGEIAYVDRPLYDYVQHGANVVGRHVPSAEFKSGLVHLLRRFAAQPALRLRNTVRHARRIYLEEIVRLELFARTLELRLGDRIPSPRARVVRRLARIGSSPTVIVWLLARSARDLRGDSPTLGAENQLVKGILWRYWQVLLSLSRR